MTTQSLQFIERRSSRRSEAVLGARIDAMTWNDALRKITAWGAARESRYVCLCNVHSVITSRFDVELKRAINNADLSAPDGAPIAWTLRQLGYGNQERISGPDLTWRFLAEAERLGQLVFFYGSTQTTLSKLRAALMTEFPRLRIAGMHSPPYRPLTEAEDEIDVDMINNSGAHVVFVGLGCPKQEKWLAAHRGRINAVMLGVGAAFDYHAGCLKRAPVWWQRNGLEWLYRLGCEPRRLFKRYLVTNTLFIVGMAWQLMSRKIFR